jgi:hypothetical protein
MHLDGDLLNDYPWQASDGSSRKKRTLLRHFNTSDADVVVVVPNEGMAWFHHFKVIRILEIDDSPFPALLVVFVRLDGTQIHNRRGAMRQVLHQRQLLAVLQTLLTQIGNGIVTLTQQSCRGFIHRSKISHEIRSLCITLQRLLQQGNFLVVLKVLVLGTSTALLQSEDGLIRRRRSQTNRLIHLRIFPHANFDSDSAIADCGYVTPASGIHTSEVVRSVLAEIASHYNQSHTKCRQCHSFGIFLIHVLRMKSFLFVLRAVTLKNQNSNLYLRDAANRCGIRRRMRVANDT